MTSASCDHPVVADRAAEKKGICCGFHISVSFGLTEDVTKNDAGRVVKVYRVRAN
ncbi:MAG TPA: hypothetical protein VKU62_10680 [Thermoanaerobaculia bacterium]|nr:hypothetical protein [Thermoanaerobaculia bacterium]